jgi:hypothetical protein
MVTLVGDDYHWIRVRGRPLKSGMTIRRRELLTVIAGWTRNPSQTGHPAQNDQKPKKMA